MTFRRLFLSGVLAVALLRPLAAQYTQQGNKLVGGGAATLAGQGGAVAISADGNTAIVGGFFDNSQAGAIWFFTRSGGAWTQQGGKMTVTNAVGPAHLGSSVAISADGNTAVAGGNFDNTGTGAAWIFTRAGAVWTQGSKLIGTNGLLANQGTSVAISGDGNTVLVGASGDNFGLGAVWVYTRSGSAWTQQGNKLAGTGSQTQFVGQGTSLALSQDGSTFIVGAPKDNTNAGAAWIFTRSGSSYVQQGAKLVGSGATGAASQGTSVAISSDGNTAVIGGPADSTNVGACWVFTRSGTAWTQQGGKLVGAGYVGTARQATAVAVSGDGNTLLAGGTNDNFLAGAAWVFTRAGGAWTQQGNKLTGTNDSGALLGIVALSSDGTTAIIGGSADSGGAGAVWIYTATGSGGATVLGPGTANPPSGSGSTSTFTFTFSDPGGWQNITVANVLVSAFLDGRHACFVAFVPSGANSGSVYLVDDAGDAAGPYSGMVLPGSGSVQNSQCSLTAAGSSVSTSGNTLTLTLAGSFTPAFAGNKVIYAAAGNAASNSGWKAVGAWNVAGGAAVSGPSVAGVSPGHTVNPTQTLVVTYNDTNGWQDISVANVLINSAINGIGACYVAVGAITAGGASVYLVDDAGDAGGPYSGMVLPGTGTVSNSQCSIAGTGSSVAGAGNTLTLTLAVTFQHAFAGNQVVYAAARSNSLNSDWQAAATVTVP